jgi:hypothetical protein
MVVCVQLVLREICCNDSFNDIVFRHCLYVLLNTIVVPTQKLPFGVSTTIELKV